MIRQTLRGRLTLALFGLTIMLILCGGLMMDRIFGNYIQELVSARLSVANHHLVFTMNNMRERWMEAAGAASRSPLARDAIMRLSGVDSDDIVSMDAIGSSLNEEMSSLISVLDAYDVLLVTKEGIVRYTYLRESDLYSQFAIEDESNDDPLTTAVRDALTLNQIGVAWGLQYEPSRWALEHDPVYSERREEGRERQSAFFVSPVMIDGAAEGALILQVRSREMNALWEDLTGLGNSGEVVVGRWRGGEFEFLNETRSKGTEIANLTGLDNNVAITHAASGGIGVAPMLDYRGIPVLAAMSYLQNVGVGLVVKIDVSEALKPIVEFRLALVRNLLLALVLTLVIAYWLWHGIERSLDILLQTPHFESPDSWEELPREMAPLANWIAERRGEVKDLIHEVVQQKLALDLHSVVAVVDRNGRIEYTNQLFENCMGLRADQLTGKYFHQLVVEHRLTKAIGGLEAETHQGGLLDLNATAVVQGEQRMRDAEGGYRWFDATVVPNINNSGEITGHIVIQTDITERVEAYRQLREARSLVEHAAQLQALNDELESVVAAASHDLRSPLIAINQLTQMIVLDDGESLSADSLTSLHIIQSRCKRMHMLLEDLVDYRRLGSRLSAPEACDLPILVQGVCDLLVIPPEIELNVEPATVYASRVALDLIVRNLIGNAVKHRDENSSIVHVRAWVEGEFQVLQVQDDGPGIPENLRDKAIKMFSTLQSRDSRDGSGMGLALVKKATEVLSGELLIHSREGRGTIIDMRWPLSM